jgi:dye decolorizing peroxidase
LAGGAVVAGGAVGALLDHELAHDGAPIATAATPAESGAPATVYGRHQPGVVDRAPACLRFVAYDLTAAARTTARSALTAALKRLTPAVESMMAGRWIAEQEVIADGMRPAGLTITVGLGAAALTASGAALPAAMAPIPAFPTDGLDPARSGGDLGIQVCADDPLVVASVVQALSAVLAPQLSARWMQNGFLPSAAGSTDPAATPRNLMGQLDGTDNPTGARLQLAVWVAGGPNPDWMVGGSYLVCRRIRMLLPEWYRRNTTERAAVIGRAVESGAPLSGGTEKSPPDFAARTAAGALAIPADAHVRLTHPANNGGVTMLRRGYSYDDGLRADGQRDAGLFFQAFQTDPATTFVAIQRRLAANDALSAFIRHESSALFAILPGAPSGGWLGQQLLAG